MGKIVEIPEPQQRPDESSFAVFHAMVVQQAKAGIRALENFIEILEDPEKGSFETIYDLRMHVAMANAGMAALGTYVMLLDEPEEHGEDEVAA